MPKDIGSIVDCLTVSVIEASVRDKLRAELFEYSPSEIVQSLASSLISEDSSRRRQGVITLSWYIDSASDLSTAPIGHMLSFLCARLADWASVEPAVQGIRAMYMKHLSSHSPPFSPEDEELVLKDRSDLSLLLGLSSPDSLPPRTNSLTESVLTKLLINVHAPSFGKQVRMEVLQLFRHLILYRSADLLPIADIVVEGLAIQGEDERDIECLSVFLDSVDSLFASEIVHAGDVSGKSLEDLFDTVKSYFPVEVLSKSASAQDKEGVVGLKKSLSQCLLRFPQQTVEFLLPQIDSVNTAEDAVAALCSLARAGHSDVLIPYILAELKSGGEFPSPRLESLWLSVLDALDETLLGEMVTSIVKEDEEGIVKLTVTSGNPRVFPHIFSAHISSSKNIDSLLQLLHKDAHLTTGHWTMDEGVAEALARDLWSRKSSADVSSTTVLSCVIGSVVNKSLLVEICQDCKVRFLQASEAMSDLVKLTVSLFESHGEIAVPVWSESETEKLLETLTEAGNASVGSVVLALFRNDVLMRYVDFIDWELSKSAMADDVTFRNFFLEHITPLLHPETFSVGLLKSVLEDGPGDESRPNGGVVGLVRKLLVDHSRFDVLDIVSVACITAAFSGIVDWEDMLSAAPVGVVGLGKVVKAAVADGKSVGRLLDFFNYFENPAKWIAAISAISDSVAEPVLVNAVIAQLTEERVVEVVGDVEVLPDKVKSVMKKIVIEMNAAGGVVGREVVEMSVSLVSVLFSPGGLMENSNLVESLVGNSLRDCVENFPPICSLLIKYLMCSKGQLAGPWLYSLMSTLSTHLSALPANVCDRFVLIQVIAVLPETIPIGKISQHRDSVLSLLRLALARETKQVVRKMLAVAVTNWFHQSP